MRPRDLTITFIAASLSLVVLCACLDASAQSLAEVLSSREAQVTATLRTRVYRVQRLLDGTEAVWEYRSLAPGTLPTRRVSPDHQTYRAWLALGRRPERLPAETVPPLPRITSEHLRELISQATVPLREALLDCQAEVAAADALGSSVAPDCTPVAEAWQVGREQAEEVLRGRYEVVR